MAVVILLRFFVFDRDLGCDFLANHAVGEQVVLAVVLVILVRHPGLFADELLKLVGIGDAGFALNVGKLLGDFRIDVEIQFLAFGLQQKLIDALAENVLVRLRHGFLKTLAGSALLAHGGFHLLVGVIDVATRNDLAIHLGDDLFDHRNLGGGGEPGGRDTCEDQLEAHTGIITSRDYKLSGGKLPHGFRGWFRSQSPQRLFQERQDACGRFGRGIERQPQHPGRGELRSFYR